MCLRAQGAGETDNGRGLLIGHAYAILRTSAAQGKRLIQLRNPWGMKEWTGAYSDGSREWTDALKRELNHTFADDGESPVQAGGSVFLTSVIPSSAPSARVARHLLDDIRRFRQVRVELLLLALFWHKCV